LHDFLETTDFVALNGRKRGEVEYTRVASNLKSVIDYVLVPYENLNKTNKFSVEKLIDLGSDHRLIWVEDCIVVNKKERKKVEYECWDLQKLKFENVRTEFEQVLSAEVRNYIKIVESFEKSCHNEKEIVDSILRVFVKIVNRVADSVIGKKKIVKGISNKWWDKDVKDKVKERCKSYRSAVKSNNEEDWKLYYKLRKEVRDLIKSKKRKLWDDLSCKVEEDFENNKKLFWSEVRNFYKPRHKKFDGVYNSNGKIVFDNSSVLQVWRDHFEKLSKENRETSDLFNNEFKKEVEAEIKVVNDISSNCDEVDFDMINIDEVVEAKKFLKKGKACGIDKLPNEFLLAGGKAIDEMLVKLFNCVIKYEYIPKLWCKGCIVPVYKNCGDKCDPNNYRGITLLSCVFKLLERVLLKRVSKIVESKIVEEQGAFFRGRGTRDQLFALSECLRFRAAENLSTYAAFIDISKAFPSVWRDGLWLRLWKYGIRGKLWRIVKSIYEKTESCVLVNGSESSWFPISRGVREGSVLSPTLFACFINELVHELKDKGFGIDIVSRVLFILLYADDIVLLAKSAEELQQMLNIVSEFCSKWRFKLNARKSAVVVFCKNKGGNEWKLGNSKIPVLNCYKYLGVHISDDLKWKVNISKIVEKAKKRLNSTKVLLRNNKLSVKARLVIWKTILRPLLEYASCTWWTNRVEEKEIERVQLSAAKTILGVNSKTSDVVVRGELGLHSLKLRRDIALLKWAGHVAKLDSSSLIKSLFELRYSFKGRGRGRTRTWRAILDSVIKNYNLVDEFKDIKNLSELEWFKLVDKKVLEKSNNDFRETLSNRIHSKLHLYRLVKNEIYLEDYLKGKLTDGVRLKFKLRSGTNGLNNELGRRCKDVSSRICKCCNLGVVEDEIHFITECPMFHSQRNSFFSNLSKIENDEITNLLNNPDISDKTEKAAIILGKSQGLSKSSSNLLNTETCNFLEAIWNSRKNFLYPPSNIAGGVNDKNVMADI
jgi:hypothetical protein